MKLLDRIDYSWEFKYYHGHLVAAHIGGKVFAYGMKGIEIFDRINEVMAYDFKFIQIKKMK